jgi:glycosyltransferase involved in cell wall biosynthesis
VISKDRHDYLNIAVRSLLDLDYPRERYEIIVVEEGDAPTPLLGVKYVFLPRRNLGLGYARNTGVRNAKGELIAFTDDDCLVDRHWLAEIVAAFADPQVGGVAGSTFAQPGSLIGNCEDILGFPGGGHRRYHDAKGRVTETNLMSGCNCAYRRDVFDKWSFKEDGFGKLGGDDYLMGILVARDYKCLYVPTAIVYHKPRGSLRRIITWFARRRINELLFEEKDDGQKNFRSLIDRPHRVMLFRVPALVLLPLLLGWVGAAIVFILGLLWYVLILRRSLPVVQYFENGNVAFLVPIVRSFMDLGALIGEWRYLTQNHEKLGSTLNEYRR